MIYTLVVNTREEWKIYEGSGETDRRLFFYRKSGE
jgi:hypothetical protein